MLKELYAKVIALLAGAGFTAYAEDCVPDGTGFPFVTCRIDPPANLHGTGCVTLKGWQRGAAAHSERLGMADALLSLVPPGGMTLRLDSGLAALFRRDGQAVTWPEASGALGVCVQFDLRAAGSR